MASSGLRLDISYEEADRIYGTAWLKFLKTCKCTLGVESGASVFDFTGDIQRAVDEYVARRPDAGFEEVQQAILAPHEGLISLNQISPRCFEAAALRTAMILFEGHYSGVLEPWRHYIPLKKDFSNIAEVVAAVRDDALLQVMVDRTYREVALNPRYSYAAFIDQFDNVIAAEIRARATVIARGPDPHSSEDEAPRAGAWGHLAATRVRISQIRIQLYQRCVVVRILLHRFIHAILSSAYRVYVALIPAHRRERLRPFVRRHILREK